MHNRLSFTDSRLEKLPLPARGSLTVHDTRVRGLILRITPAGNRIFMLYRRIDGRPTRVTLGNFGAIGSDKARELAEKYNGQIADGVNPLEARRARRLESTVKDLWEQYLDKHARPYTRTWKKLERSYTRFLKPWAGRRLTSIANAEIQALHARIGRNHGQYMANRVLQLLRSMFNRGIAWGMVKENPCRMVKLYREEKRRRFLEPQELGAFFKAMFDEPHGEFFLSCLLTGARRSNVLAMRWADVDLARRLWTVPASESKNAESLQVFLVPEMVDLLKQRRRAVKGLWVFPGTGRKRSRTGHMVSPKQAWARLLKTAGLNGLRLHDLRRSLGTYQASAGANLVTIARTLGHKSLQSAAVYAQILQDAARSSMENAVSTMLVHGGLKAPAQIVQLPPQQTDQRKVQP